MTTATDKEITNYRPICKSGVKVREPMLVVIVTSEGA